MILTVLLYLFLVCVAIQVMFAIRYFSAFARAKRSSSPAAALKPTSVVVCARNEEHNLRKLTPAIMAQKHIAFELIVVDDQSTDGTYDYLLEQKNLYPNLKIVKVNDTPGHVNRKKYGLTLGIKAASYEQILLTDADCIPASDGWIAEMTRGFEGGADIVIGYSPYTKRSGFLNWFIRFETLWTGIQYLGEALLGNPYMGVGRNLAYKKSFFLDKKGFNKYLKVTGGDDDLFINEHATKHNTKVAIGARTNMLSYPKTRFRDYVRQKIRHLHVGKFYKAKDRLRLGFLALTNILCWVSFIVLLLYRHELYWTVGGYVVKLAFLTTLLYYAGKRLGDKINIALTPLFDFLGFIYYLLLGTRALFTKRVKWN